MPTSPAPAQFFSTPAEFCRWLKANHATATEICVGLHRKGTGGGGITYAEALDEALCHGWIDGRVGRIDATRYQIRFTPRNKRSIWSKVNLAHVERLKQAGRMKAPGLAAFEARDPARSGLYAFENPPQKLSPEAEQVFRVNAQAWAYFSVQASSYRRTALWWVMSGKKEETRARRLALLMADSARGKWLDIFRASPPARKKTRP